MNPAASPGATSTAQILGQETLDPGVPTAAEGVQFADWRRRAAEAETIRALRADGLGLMKIACRTGRSRKQVRDVLRGWRPDHSVPSPGASTHDSMA